MSRTIGGPAGDSGVAKGIPTETLDETHRSRHANAAKTESIRRSGLVLLLTRDIELEQQSAIAAAASGARLIIARTAGVALQIIYQRGCQLDLVVIDFDNGTRGIALLSALSMWRADLPIVALTSTDRDHSTVLGFADGAACWLTKPMNAAELEIVIRVLAEPNPRSKQPGQKMPKNSQLTPCDFEHRRKCEVNPNADRTRRRAKTLRERASSLRKELQP